MKRLKAKFMLWLCKVGNRTLDAYESECCTEEEFKEIEQHRKDSMRAEIKAKKILLWGKK